MPHGGDRVEFQVKRTVPHNFQTFGYGLHHSVLDTVVDHFNKMAGTGIAHSGATTAATEGCEERLDPAVDRLVPTNHKAGAVSGSFGATAGPGIEEMHTSLLQLVVAPLTVLVPGVSAINEDIPRSKQRQQAGDHRIHR